ncbi:MAG TPA: hypothetical protein DDW50_20315 [Firmicutes bacterium]|jgi:hypothetical protein|nr:hypothetical protein [Bacillota bacterium]
MERFSANKLIGLSLKLSIILFMLAMTAGCMQSKPLALKPAENIRALLRVDHHTGPFHIGDEIPVILTVEARKGISFQLPGFDESTTGGLELKTKQAMKPETFSGEIRQTTRYLFAGWHVGRFTIPAANLPYQTSSNGQGAIKLAPISVNLSSVLPKGISGDELLTFNIQGIQSPLNLEPRYFLLKWFGLGAFIIVLLGLLLWLYQRSVLKSGPASEVVKEPAHFIALRRLDAIRSMSLTGPDGCKIFYSELSECIREYMENRYSIRALEMTTEEFLKSLTTGAYLNQEQQALLNGFMQQSDLVKFANHSPSDDEAEASLRHIKELVEATKELPEQPDTQSVSVQTTL